jgi:hypothetical protein
VSEKILDTKSALKKKQQFQVWYGDEEEEKNEEGTVHAGLS